MVTTAWNAVSLDSVVKDTAGRTVRIVRRMGGHRYAINYIYGYFPNGHKRTVTITSDVGIPFASETDVAHDTLPALDSVTLNSGGGHESGVSTIYYDRDGNLSNTHWPDSLHYVGWLRTSLHQIYQNAPQSLVSTLHPLTAIRDSVGREFGYDSLGRVITDNRMTYPTNHYFRRRFAYDSLGQLLKVSTFTDSACYGADTIAFGFLYDHCVNSTFVLTQDSATYDKAGNRLFPGATYSTMGSRLQTGPVGTSYSYDDDGNLVTRTYGGVTDSLYWDATGLLTVVGSGGATGLHHRYSYNAFGQLVRRETATGGGSYHVDRYFLWDETQLIAELDSTGTKRIAQYVYYGGTDRPFALVTGNGTLSTTTVRYLYQDEVENNVTAVMHDAATMDQMTRYTAWGSLYQRPINTMADTNRLGWKGLMYEGDSTRLYYVRNRWYDPQVGRFISEDPIGLAGGPNLYAFAHNDPINGSDPNGLCDTGDISNTDDNPNFPDGDVFPDSNGTINLCHGDGPDGTWESGAGLLNGVTIYRTRDGNASDPSAESSSADNLALAVGTGVDATVFTLSKAQVISKVTTGVLIEAKALSRTGTVIGAIAGGAPALYNIYTHGLNVRNGRDLGFAVAGLILEGTGGAEIWDGSVGLVIATGALVNDIYDARH